MTTDTSREAIIHAVIDVGGGYVQMLADDYKAITRERDAALAREAALREALAPLVEIIAPEDAHDLNPVAVVLPPHYVEGDTFKIGINAGDVRRAHAALNSPAAAAEARDAALRMEAIGDAMSVLHMAPRDGESPRDALRRLIEAEHRIALDPAVSAEARALVERGRQKGIEEFAQACIDAQPATAENPSESHYFRGHFNGVMEYGKAILDARDRALATPAAKENDDG
jgi:hypothetical protein